MCVRVCVGWLLFPIGFALGPLFTGIISAEAESIFYFFGDICAKNVYVPTAVSRAPAPPASLVLHPQPILPTPRPLSTPISS